MDIETVEEGKHGALFDKMLKTDRRASTESRYVLVCVLVIKWRVLQFCPSEFNVSLAYLQGFQQVGARPPGTALSLSS